MRPAANFISAGKTVRAAYTVWSDEAIVETTQGRPPLYYRHGDPRVLPAFQKKLEGMREGEETEFTLEAHEAYGPWKAEAVVDIPRDQFPAGPMKAGMILHEELPDGTLKIGRVEEVGEASVRMNFNHPMAGKTLRYKVRIVSVMAGTDVPPFMPAMRFEKETPEQGA